MVSSKESLFQGYEIEGRKNDPPEGVLRGPLGCEHILLSSVPRLYLRDSVGMVMRRGQSNGGQDGHSQMRCNGRDVITLKYSFSVWLNLRAVVQDGKRAGSHTRCDGRV